MGRKTDPEEDFFFGRFCHRLRTFLRNVDAGTSKDFQKTENLSRWRIFKFFHVIETFWQTTNSKNIKILGFTLQTFRQEPFARWTAVIVRQANGAAIRRSDENRGNEEEGGRVKRRDRPSPGPAKLIPRVDRTETGCRVSPCIRKRRVENSTSEIISGLGARIETYVYMRKEFTNQEFEPHLRIRDVEESRVGRIQGFFSKVSFSLFLVKV